MTGATPYQTTFNHAMELWFLPEIEKRLAAGVISKPYDLRAAQVIFHTNSKPPEIRLNDEVKGIPKGKLKQGLSKHKGDTIYEDEIEEYESFQLLETEDPDCGYFTILRLRTNWFLFWDFRYNKGKAREILKTAWEFFGTASYALSRGHLRAFMDNLFSAVELAASILLVILPLPNKQRRQNHRHIQAHFNLSVKHGNFNPKHRDSFNKLVTLRDKARYLKGSFSIQPNEAKVHLKAAKELLKRAEELLS